MFFSLSNFSTIKEIESGDKIKIGFKCILRTNELIEAK